MSDSDPKTIKPYEEGKGYVIYKCGSIYQISANAGAVLGDHAHEAAETLWFVSGKGTLQVGEDMHDITGPCKIYIDRNVYHKLTAHTDMSFVEKRHAE